MYPAGELAVLRQLLLNKLAAGKMHMFNYLPGTIW